MLVSQNVLYAGQDGPLPQAIPLRAGPLSMVYQDGDLRRICLGSHEIVRRIYVAVRDENWDTILPAFTNVRLDIGADRFSISYDVSHRRGDIDFAWQGSITGDAEGNIVLTMDGAARSSFMKSRIGFCVLHPMALAGQPCVIEGEDGARREDRFPDAVTAVQPCIESIRAISHEVIPGVRARIAFAGDIFEMEDQRNWTDASFKIYSTPLALPWPVRIKAGDRVVQSVALSLQGTAPGPQRELQGAALEVNVGEHAIGPLPQLGLGLASHGRPLSGPELQRLRELHLSHLRVDLNPTEDTASETLERASSEARALGLPLEVALFLPEESQDALHWVAAEVSRLGASVGRWLVFDAASGSTTQGLLPLARERLSALNPNARFGGGTNIFYYHLNLAPPDTRGMDLVCYSISPQFHAFDHVTLVENLQAQASTVAAARRLCGGLPVAVSPITLKPRFNPDAIGPEPEPAPGTLPPQVDPRQMSLLGAGWTLGSLKYMAESQVESATYYETTGWRGVMETEDGSPLPSAFRSIQGSVFPLYHVLADVGEFAGGEVYPVTVSDALQVDGLAVGTGGRKRLLLANLSAEPQRVIVRGLRGEVRIRRLDETNALQAMRQPEAFRAEAGCLRLSSDGALALDLLPFALVRIDPD